MSKNLFNIISITPHSFSKENLQNRNFEKITNFLSKVYDKVDINTDIIFGIKTNKNLEEDEMFIRVLMSGL